MLLLLLGQQACQVTLRGSAGLAGTIAPHAAVASRRAVGAEQANELRGAAAIQAAQAAAAGAGAQLLLQRHRLRLGQQANVDA